jgi:hypothetical protein
MAYAEFVCKGSLALKSGCGVCARCREERARMEATAVCEIERDKENIIVRGLLPRKQDGSVDLYKIDRLLLEVEPTNERVAILKRILEQRPGRI